MPSPKAKRERRAARRKTAEQQTNRRFNAIWNQRVTVRRRFPDKPAPLHRHGSEIRLVGIDPARESSGVTAVVTWFEEYGEVSPTAVEIINERRNRI